MNRKRNPKEIHRALMAEAKRYAEAHQLAQYKRKPSLLQDLKKLKNPTREQKFGMTAIAVAFPSAATLIFYSSTLTSNTAIACLTLMFLSTPFWILAEAERNC